MRRAVGALIVFGALVATGTAPALAVSVSASATLSELQVSVEDAIPDDGIAPSLTVLETWYDFHRQEMVGASSLVVNYADVVWDGMPFVAFATTPGLSGQVGKPAEPGPPPHSGGLFAEGAVDVPDGYLDMRSRVSFYFLVGIGTRVTITSTATASTSIEDCPLGDDCFALADADFSPGDGLDDEITLTDALAHGAGGPRSISDQESRTLTFEVETDATGGAFRTLQVGLVAKASETRVWVPEPSTAALLASGLVLVGAARPRRARRH